MVAGRALPPLILDDDEAIATALGLRLAAAGNMGTGDTADVAARAEAKLRRFLPAKLRRRTDELLAGVEVSTNLHTLPSPELVLAITRAIADRQILAFDYSSSRGSTHRQVEPARLIGLQQRWYLFAWDCDRKDWRTFRIDRIVSSPKTGTLFVPRMLPAKNLADYLREHFRGIPELTITVVLHTGAEDAARKLYRVDGTLEPLTATSCRYTAHVDSYAWLTLVLVLSDIEFTIIEPDSFREHIAALASRLTRGSTQ